MFEYSMSRKPILVILDTLHCKLEEFTATQPDYKGYCNPKPRAQLELK